ncbi:unnamed protein product, partial [Ectocarpus sp. 8 AP-2014]
GQGSHPPDLRWRRQGFTGSNRRQWSTAVPGRWAYGGHYASQGSEKWTRKGRLEACSCYHGRRLHAVPPRCSSGECGSRGTPAPGEGQALQARHAGHRVDQEAAHGPRRRGPGARHAQGGDGRGRGQGRPRPGRAGRERAR